MKSIIPFFVRIVASFTAVFTNFILAKHLGVEVFGIFSGMLSIVFIINLITDWGFNAYGAQLLAQKTSLHEQNEFVNNVVAFKCILSVVFTILYILFCIVGAKQPLYYTGALLILLSFINPEWICRGMYFPDMAGYRQLLFSVLNISFFYVLYWLHAPFWLTFVSYTLNTVVSFGIVLFWVQRKSGLQWPLRRFSIKKIQHSGIVKHTSVYFYGFLLNNFNYTSGIVVLTFLVNAHSVGVYASYYNIFATLVAPVAISYGLFAPKAHLMDAKSFFTDYFVVIIYMMAAGIIFYFFGQFFYKLFYPTSFYFDAKLNILAASVFVLYCLENLFVVCGVLQQKPKQYLICNAVGLITVLSMYVFLFFTHRLSVHTALLTIAVMQMVMLVVSFYWYGYLVKYLLQPAIALVGLLVVLLGAFLYWGLSIYICIVTAILILLFIAGKLFVLLKNLY